VKHNRVGAVAVLGGGDRCAEAAVWWVPVQEVASTVATRRSVTQRRIYSVNACGFQVVTSLSGHVIMPDEDMWRWIFTATPRPGPAGKADEGRLPMSEVGVVPLAKQAHFELRRRTEGGEGR